MSFRLRGQYTVTIAGLVFVTALVLSTALYQQQRTFSHELEAAATQALSRAMQRQAQAQGLALARSLADRIADDIYRADLHAIAGNVADASAYPAVASVRVLDHDGKLLNDGTKTNERLGQQADTGWLRPVFKTRQPRVAGSAAVVRVGMPVMAGSVLLGVVAIDISRAEMLDNINVERTSLLGTMHREGTRFLLTGAGLSVVLLFGAMLAAVAVAQGLAEPIQALARRARLIGRGQRDVAFEIRRGDELGDLARAFDEMAVALRQTTVSKDYVDNILQSMAEMLIVTDASQRIVTANRACLRELGCTEDTIRGLPIDGLLPELAALAPAADAEAQARDAATGEEPSGRRDVGNGATGTYADKSGATYFALTRPDGGTLPVHVSVSPLRERGDDLVGSVYVMQNVTERLAAQEQSERSLQEKEILLKEVHHRVKNNLQIISSILSLQANRSLDDTTRSIFLESENRIRAMALIHEQLYRAGDLARVDMSQYLENLSTQIVRSIGKGGCTVDVQVDQSLREVPVDVAIPLGLIVNELLSNSVRHAFPDARSGTVSVHLRARGTQHELEVSDDGVGLPPGFDADSMPTLGLKLVRALVGQLQGSFEITSTAGVTLRAVFPAARATRAAVVASPPAAATVSRNRRRQA
ncbi:MAG: HAMP domain-containing protein [Deltaproteobacteria bacterium]|nr:HAMP domain-containing protein [Deltaproteobacteria bacterium]